MKCVSAYCKGLPFWIGMADKTNGKVCEIHNFQEAKEADFHTDFYFSEAESRMENNGKRYVFWVELNADKKEVQILSDDEIPEDILRVIRAQIFPVFIDEPFQSWERGSLVAWHTPTEEIKCMVEEVSDCHAELKILWNKGSAWQEGTELYVDEHTAMDFTLIK